MSMSSPSFNGWENTENFRFFDYAREVKSADEEDPPSPTLTTASVDPSFIPNFGSKTENLKLFQSFPAKALAPKALHSETMHSKAPSFYKARKSRRKAYTHIPSLIGGKLRTSSIGGCPLSKHLHGY